MQNKIFQKKQKSQSWRELCYEIIFEADTAGGKLFDILLLIAIVLSVLVVMCESDGRNLSEPSTNCAELSTWLSE